MSRLFYTLLFLLIGLILPIVVINSPIGQLFGYRLYGFWAIFGLGFSGPSLVLYSLLVYHFAQVKGKNILSGIALFIGLP